MDLDIVEFVREPFRADDNAIDFDFEYDAPKYYDFTREESAFVAREAEFWFETALNYPPSQQKGYKHMAPDAAKAKASSLVKPPPFKHSNFMNPTACHLARQNYPSKFHCERMLRRYHKMENLDWISSAIGVQFTKRQRLEAGYLLKVARLKHQTSFSHKYPKKDGDESKTAPARLKVTIPKEPNLETACRAERYRSKVNLESMENEKSSSSAFRARPLNRKVKSKSSASHDPQYETRNGIRGNFIGTLQEIPEAIDKSKSNCLNKEQNSANQKNPPTSPPTESFSKLSLAPGVRSHARNHLKLALANKENEPGSILLKHEKSMTKSPSLVGKGGQCGNVIRRCLQSDSNNQIAV